MEADQAATQAAAAVCARNRSKNRFNVVVYCGSSVGNNPEYARQAEGKETTIKTIILFMHVPLALTLWQW